MIKLKNGDCLDKLKELENDSVDLLLTDPPYNISRDNNFKTMGRAGIDFGEWDKGFDLTNWLSEIPRVLKPNGSVVIFNAWRNLPEISSALEDLGFEVKDLIRWEKTNPMPRNRDRRYIVDYEFAIWAVPKGSKWIFNRQDPNYQRPEFKHSISIPKNDKIHPTQKPVALMEDLILIHSNEGDVVLDCFMGSGTTGVACVNKNRSFIGIELDLEYYNKAKDRIREVINQKEEK